MLNALNYSVTFPSTGRTLSQAVQFMGGFGAITGPNEAGKSFIIEMVRFSLFGTKALRGKTDDYKKLQVSLTFTVKDVQYVVERTISTAKILRGGLEIAVGVRPVNDKVVQILGFGLAVFDVACSANQGDLEALGSMQPTERKRMVDSVIGLGVIEDLAKSAGTEATALQRRVDDLKTMMVEPVEPVEPEGYQLADLLREQLEGLTSIKTQLDQHNGWLSHQRTEPVAPECPVKETAAELLVGVNQQQELQAERLSLLKTLDALPEAPAQDVDLDEIEAQITAFENYRRQQAFLKLHPAPAYSAKDLKDARKDITNWETWHQLQHLTKKRDDLAGQGVHRCPDCNHEFPIAVDEIEAIDKEIEALPRLRKEPTQPAMSMLTIEQQERVNANWESVEAEWNELRAFVPVEAPPMDRKMLEQARVAVANATRRRQIVETLTKLEDTIREQPNYNALLNKRRVYDLEQQRYEQDVEAYNRWDAERKQRQAWVDAHTRLVADLPVLRQQYEAARAYETAGVAYEKAMAVYADQVEMCGELSEESEDWRRAREALTNLRAMVKQHLVPSLNRVASHMIKQMTGGQRQTIDVDEEFNITVDGQALNTLSGSGKAVANLALRIGLGQVLTNNVFSLFMGDEIDASMDKDRAENTANTLQTLKGKISQIVLVTHKYPSADYYISLGTNLNEQQAQH